MEDRRLKGVYTKAEGTLPELRRFSFSNTLMGAKTKTK